MNESKVNLDLLHKYLHFTACLNYLLQEFVGYLLAEYSDFLVQDHPCQGVAVKEIYKGRNAY